MSPRTAELAEKISANVEEINLFIQSNDLAQPSFDPDGPVQLDFQSPRIETCRVNAIEAAAELQSLLQGPQTLFRPECNGTSLHAIYKYDIARKVPLRGDITFTDLAVRCKIHEPDLRRILRFAMCHYYLFQEIRKGYVSHTAASRIVAENKHFRDTLGVLFDEFWQAQSKTVEAMERFKSQDTNETGYSLAFSTNLPFYQYQSAHPQISERFASAMKAFGGESDVSPEFLVNNFQWQVFDAGKVVDLGGSTGSVSIAIAEKYPELKFIVQDLPDVIQAAGQESLPTHLADRIVFMAHDFFTEQPIVAEVYLLRYVLHNWPDAYAIKILRQLIPALKSGSRIIVNDHILPEPNTLSLMAEREVRSMDMLMLSLNNARERDRDDWEMLFREADDRFRIVNVNVPKGSALAIIEARWED